MILTEGRIVAQYPVVKRWIEKDDDVLVLIAT
jgi:hypothetical protein